MFRLALAHTSVNTCGAMREAPWSQDRGAQAHHLRGLDYLAPLC